MHYLLFNREFGQFNLEWLAQYPLLINLMTHGAILIEFALAFWLWFRPTRRWAILGGVALHLGIRPMLNVPGFGEVMTATYLTFLAPDELDAFLSILSPRALLARLGLRVPNFASWQAVGRPVTIPDLQQLEFPFEGAGAQPSGRADRRRMNASRSSGSGVMIRFGSIAGCVPRSRGRARSTRHGGLARSRRSRTRAPSSRPGARTRRPARVGTLARLRPARPPAGAGRRAMSGPSTTSRAPARKELEHPHRPAQIEVKDLLGRQPVQLGKRIGRQQIINRRADRSPGTGGIPGRQRPGRDHPGRSIGLAEKPSLDRMGLETECGDDLFCGRHEIVAEVAQ